jgi:hypothetical protein
MLRIVLAALLALVLLGCDDGGDEGDTAVIVPPTSQSTVVEDNDSCVISAPSPEEAIEDAEEFVGDGAVAVDELEDGGGLDQQTRTFRVYFKDVIINTGVCSDNEINVTVNDNDTSADTNVNVGDQ